MSRWCQKIDYQSLNQYLWESLQATQCDEDRVSLLCRLGADLDSKDRTGKTALHHACSRRDVTLSLITLLITKENVRSTKVTVGHFSSTSRHRTCALSMYCQQGPVNRGVIDLFLEFSARTTAALRALESRISGGKTYLQPIRECIEAMTTPNIPAETANRQNACRMTK